MKKVKKFNIQNIGSFLQFNWEESIPNNKDKEGNPIENIISDNNIFYGDNGNGKSTLVKIFKKINGNEIELKKNWNDQTTEMKFEIFDDDKSYNLESTEFKNKFIIFDKDFILENVGDISDKEKYQSDSNKARGAKIIQLGGFGKKETILEKYDEIIKDVEEKNKSFLEKIKLGGEAINRNLENDKKISEYKQFLEEINSFDLDYYTGELDERNKKISPITEIIKNFENLQKLVDLEKIDELQFDKEKFENTFKEPFIGVDFFYDEKEYIQEIFKITGKNNLDTCLFCEQKIKNGEHYIERINKLSINFSTKEKEVSDNLKELEKIITYLKENNKEIEDIHTKNKLNFNNFSKFESSYQYDESFKINLSQTFLNFLEKLLIEITEKNNVKSKTKTIDLQILEDFINDLNKEISHFNENIKSINLKISELKKVNIESKKLEKNKLENELNEFQNKYFIKNNFETIQTFFHDYEKHLLNSQNILKLTQIKNTYKANLTEEFKIFSGEYGKYIGEVLKDLNSSLQINFEVKNGTSIYSKGAARYGFEIHYNSQNIIGELSEGEKRSIALAYFFAEIKKKIEEKKLFIGNEESLREKLVTLLSIKEEKIGEDKKTIGIEIGEINNQLKKIEKNINKKAFLNNFLILDDPAVDFDIGHKKFIANFIAKYSSEFKQTFIFSHDSLFVDYLKNSFNTFKSGNLKYFWIYKTQSASNITVIDKNVFEKYLSDIKHFIDNGTRDITDLYVLTYKLRFCIEKMIKDDVLGFQNSSVDSLISHIGNSEKFGKLKSKTEELKSLYNFCNHNGSHFSDVEGGNNALKKMVTDFFDLYKFINDIKSI